jgi:hypothetical protein
MDLLDHYCYAWPVDIVMPEDEASSDVDFIVEVEATHTYVLPSVLEDDSGDFDNLDSETFQKTFRVKRDALLHESTSRSTISGMLFEVCVPLGIQEFMLQRILACARDMATQKLYAGRKVLRMRVAVEVTECMDEVLPDFVNDDGYVLGLPSDDQVCGLVPASKSSIEALEKVENIEGRRETCSICLEELLIAPAASRMPCSHLFHQNCIVNWLERTNFCPLCRFKLPPRQ